MPPTATSSTTEARKLAALEMGMHGDRRVLAWGMLLLALALLPFVVLHPVTDNLSVLDAGLALMAVLVMGFNVIWLPRHSAYLRFRWLTMATVVMLGLFLAITLLGENAKGLAQGRLPWIAPYFALVVSYFYAYLLDRHARLTTAALIALGVLIFGLHQWRVEGAGMNAEAWWLLMGLTTGLVHAALLMRSQARLHASIQSAYEEDIRKLEASEAALTREYEHSRERPHGG